MKIRRSLHTKKTPKQLNVPPLPNRPEQAGVSLRMRYLVIIDFLN